MIEFVITEWVTAPAFADSVCTYPSFGACVHLCLAAAILCPLLGDTGAAFIVPFPKFLAWGVPELLRAERLGALQLYALHAAS